MPALREKPPKEAEIVSPDKCEWEEKTIVMDICRRDPETGKLVCVKNGFRMVIRVAKPKRK